MRTPTKKIGGQYMRINLLAVIALARKAKPKKMNVIIRVIILGTGLFIKHDIWSYGKPLRKWTVLLSMQPAPPFYKTFAETLHTLITEQYAYSDNTLLIQVPADTNTLGRYSITNTGVHTSTIKRTNLKESSLCCAARWMNRKYQAKNYGLFWWGHSTGIVPQGTEQPCDLNYSEFIEALQKTKTRYSFIALDTCLMGMLEVAYDLQQYTKLLIACPTAQLYEGLNYSKFMQRLPKLSSSPAVIAKELVDDYRIWRHEHYPLAPHTLIAFDLTQVSIINKTFNNLCTRLLHLLQAGDGEVRQKLIAFILQARFWSFSLDKQHDYVDLLLFIEHCITALKNDTRFSSFKELENSFKSFKQALESMVISSSTGRAHSVGIYFPLEKPSAHYKKLGFCQKSQWPVFLEELYTFEERKKLQ